jgi:hypothetical protein
MKVTKVEYKNWNKEMKEENNEKKTEDVWSWD